MVLALIKIKAVAGNQQAILDILRFVQWQVRVKPGCLECSIYEERGERRALLYLERWQSGEELDRHIQSSLYLRILTAMELASDRPEISFHEVSETKGIELIEGLRAYDS